MNWTAVNYDDPSTLPKPDRRLIIVLADRTPAVATEGWLVDGDEGRWRIEATDAYNDHLEFFGTDVSHWMYMPEPPTGDADGG